MNYELKRCDTAAEVFKALDVTDPSTWPSDDPWSNPWLFRGHADARWKLTPSAWRKENERLLRPFFDAVEIPPEEWKPNHSYQFHGLAERALIKAWANLADEAALELPPDAFGEIGVGASSRASPNWPDYRSPITALAQHHGVPTRLIDWTRDSHAALFFAAEEAPPSRATHSAIWALRFDPGHANGLVEVHCPHSANVNLHAQQGVLLTWKDPEALCRGVDWPALEENVVPGCLRKIEFPVKLRGEVLQRLWALHKTRGHLMPSLENIARTIRTRWEVPPRWHDIRASGHYIVRWSERPAECAFVLIEYTEPGVVDNLPRWSFGEFLSRSFVGSGTVPHDEFSFQGPYTTPDVARLAAAQAALQPVARWTLPSDKVDAAPPS